MLLRGCCGAELAAKGQAVLCQRVMRRGVMVLKGVDAQGCGVCGGVWLVIDGRRVSMCSWGAFLGLEGCSGGCLGVPVRSLMVCGC